MFSFFKQPTNEEIVKKINDILTKYSKELQFNMLLFDKNGIQITDEKLIQNFLNDLDKILKKHKIILRIFPSIIDKNNEQKTGGSNTSV